MKRNKFSLSYYRLLSCKQGQLVPVGLTEVLPGDSVRHHTSGLIRVAPLVHPVMHPCHVAFRSFFVPTRIVWDNFADNFITGGPDGDDNTEHPYINTPVDTGFAVGSLGDYLGIPTGVASKKVSAIPFRVYNAIRNEYFRDKQIQDAVANVKTDGLDSTSNVTLQNVNWEKDYFTSSRLEPQLGDEVTIGLTGNAPITVAGDGTFADGALMREKTTGAIVPSLAGMGTTASGELQSGANRMYLDPNDTLVADLSAVTGISVNDLRMALSTQRFQEHRSRFGSTYIEYLRYLGLISSDARLQLPEYLGGSKDTIQFSEVLGTDSTNLGTLGGHGIAAARSPAYQKYFEEHGYIMTVMYVRPKTVYMSGLPRTFSRETKEDYWQKEFEHTGQQSVLKKEVYFGDSEADEPFGYQDVYDEYRRSESQVSGEFRTTLKDWHMAREFTNDVDLDPTFVTADPTTRIYKATTADQLYVMVSHRMKARRMLSKVGSSFTY